MWTYFTTLALILAWAKISVANPVYNSSNTPNGFRYLGSTRSSNGKSQETLYFTYSEPMKWDIGQHLCLNMFGNDAALISLETPQEEAFITNFLKDSGNSMESYWTAGKFEPNRNLFSWERGDLVTSVPWDVGHPTEQQATTKLLMYKTGDKWNLRTESKDALHPFICEVTLGSSTEPIPCFTTNDLVIVMDSSGSIGASAFQFSRTFARDLAKAYLKWYETRISLIVFSTSVSTVFDLSARQSLNDDQILSRIMTAPYLDAETNSHLGLARAKYVFEEHPRFVTKNVVFLTDGQSTVPDETRVEAERLRALGIRAFAVGITNNVNVEELKFIAGNDNYVFHTDDYESLVQLLKPISTIICSE